MRSTAVGLVSILALATVQAQSVQVSIGIRETGFNGNLTTTIGGNGGFGGGIEWIDLDVNTLPLDGSWNTFTFDLTNPATVVTAFAGGSANGVLEGSYGTIEHIRILNNNGVTAPMTILVDDVVDTTATLGPVVVEDFEFYLQGDEVMFQEPSFSGSTSGNVLPGGTSGAEFTLASPTPGVYAMNFQFLDASTNRWVRLTSFNTLNRPNPVVQLDDNSVITLRMAGFTECATDLGSQGPGNAIASLCGTGLNVNEGMSFSIAGAPPSTFAAVGISLPGFPDLPILGGNIVSGTGLLFSIPRTTDADGFAQLTLTGNALAVDFMMQAAVLDLTLPMSVGFTNAFQANYGQ